MRRLIGTFPLAALLVLSSSVKVGAKESTDIIRSIEQNQSHYSDIARQIWDFAEVGYQEEKSSALLQSELEKAGFNVQRGVAEIPTAFVASYGQGRPVIAILAEFDALPGLSQEVATEKKPVVENAPGHGCGHHLFGTASTAAAIEVREWMESSNTPGTIRLYGTPAEEGGAGKVYMVRAGLFDDVDVTFAWHPGDSNDASPERSLANKSAKFRFYGRPSHAAGGPEMGRSALDGVEAMNDMVNMMREHVPSDSRIHYVITRGGGAPNVVPDFAEVYYYCRHPEIDQVKENFDWIVKAAEGAAMGTGTRVEYEVIHGLYPMLPNHHLGRLLYGNLKKVGGVKYTPEEQAFAEKLSKTFLKPEPLGSQETVRPWKPRERGGASTDVADVSWAVPTAEFRAATNVPGTPGHSWQAVACGGMSIGFKGMIVATKTLALTAVDVLQDPSHVEKARREFLEARGPDFKYEPLLGDRKPPLDYRK
jgi:aminobenzoyl-glutamate utilization protein B